MNFLSRNNLIPLLIGELCFVLLFFVSYNIAYSLSLSAPKGILIGLSSVLFPLLALAFVKVASFGVRYFAPLFQAAKFILVGILNTLVDIGVFNILAAFFGATTLFLFSVFKMLSFIVAVLNSYLFNRTWVFEPSQNSGTFFGEMSSFFAISVGGLAINISSFLIFSTILSIILDVPLIVINTSAALFASVASLSWNFLGYKFWVFK